MLKQTAVIADQVQAGDDNREQDRRQEEIKLALHAIVNLRNARGGLLFAFGVLDQQSRNRGNERGLAGLQGVADLFARAVLVTRLGPCEHPVIGIPELIQRLGQVAALVGRARSFAKRFFAQHGIVQIRTDSRELRAPGNQGIRLARIQHVAHRQGDGVEIILDAKKLQGITAVAIHQFTL